MSEKDWSTSARTSSRQIGTTHILQATENCQYANHQKRLTVKVKHASIAAVAI